MKNTIRKAFMLYLQPDKAEEYNNRHNPIWPELQVELKKYGVSNYSIFIHPTLNYLFGYYEIGDENLFVRIGESEVCKNWWSYMTEVLICDDNNSQKGKEDMLLEIFHLN